MALVHDWLTGTRGGERCLEVACELFPDAPLFTLFHVPGTVPPVVENRRVIVSALTRLPGVTQRREYLPLFPLAVRGFDLRGYDLILSLSHCVAKGIRTPHAARHLCYCFTPMRYVWDRYADYVGNGAGWATRLAAPAVAPALRAWDRRTHGVHRFVAISRFVADRIRHAYDRSADVIYPPVDVTRFSPASVEDFYLVVSALVLYKRVDLAVEAATRLGRRLLVVGTGPEERRLRAGAGPTVEFLGWRPDADVADLYARCRALLFPGVEDFGIVPLEAAAAGRPTIALARGGVLETMVPLEGKVPLDGEVPLDPTGPERGAAPTAVFFAEQTVDGLVTAIRTFEGAESRFDAQALRARAERFGRARFKRELAEYIDASWRSPLADGPPSSSRAPAPAGV